MKAACEPLTFSPSVVRIEMAFGTSSAVFCFFRIFILETGTITYNTHNSSQTRLFKHPFYGYFELKVVKFYYLRVLEQHRGKEADVGVGDIQPAVIRHLLLQGADVG